MSSCSVLVVLVPCLLCVGVQAQANPATNQTVPANSGQTNPLPVAAPAAPAADIAAVTNTNITTANLTTASNLAAVPINQTDSTVETAKNISISAVTAGNVSVAAVTATNVSAPSPPVEVAAGNVSTPTVVATEPAGNSSISARNVSIPTVPSGNISTQPEPVLPSNVSLSVGNGSTEAVPVLTSNTNVSTAGNISTQIAAVTNISTPAVAAGNASTLSLPAGNVSTPIVGDTNVSIPVVTATNTSIPTVTATNTSIPAEAATNISTPAVVATNISTPIVVATNISTPAVTATNISTPVVAATNISTPDIATTNISTATVTATNISTPTVAATNISTQDVSSLNTSNPDVSVIEPTINVSLSNPTNENNNISTTAPTGNISTATTTAGNMSSAITAKPTLPIISDVSTVPGVKYPGNVSALATTIETGEEAGITTVPTPRTDNTNTTENNTVKITSVETNQEDVMVSHNTEEEKEIIDYALLTSGDGESASELEVEFQDISTENTDSDNKTLSVDIAEEEILTVVDENSAQLCNLSYKSQLVAEEEAGMLDLQTQLYILSATFGGVIFLLIMLVLVLALSVARIKEQLHERIRDERGTVSRNGNGSRNKYAYENGAFSGTRNGHANSNERSVDGDDLEKLGYTMYTGGRGEGRESVYKVSDPGPGGEEDIPLTDIRTPGPSGKSPLMKYEEGVVPLGEREPDSSSNFNYR